MNPTLGARINYLRKRQGLTQRQLAEQIGVSSQAVSKWENDLACPDITLMYPLSRILNVSTDELLAPDSRCCLAVRG